MFETIKNYLPWNIIARKRFYKRWEKMSGVLEEKKDQLVQHCYPINDQGLSRAFAIWKENEWLNNQQSEKEEKIKHVEDALCGSCKKKIKLKSFNNDDYDGGYEPTVKVVCENTVVYRFHFDCWKSVNSVLDKKFEMKDGVKISGE